MKRLLVFVFAVTLLGSCKKYPENTGISLQSAKKRITKRWQLKSVNDSLFIDTTNINSQIWIVEQFQYHEFLNDGSLLIESFYNYKEIDSNGNILYDTNWLNPTISGFWEFRDNKKKLFIHTIHQLPLNNTTFNSHDSVVFDILKLKKSELILFVTDTSNNQSYRKEYIESP